MVKEDFEEVKAGIVRRKSRRIIGLFIDGVGLDRATKRIDRKVEISKLVQGVTSGLQVEVAKYYTLIPHEDDARQFAFLDAVERAGLEVIVRRLPPKNVKRVVSVDVDIATDLISFAYGFFANKSAQQVTPTPTSSEAADAQSSEPRITLIKRSAVLVCPSPELGYAIHVANQLGVETTVADFGKFGSAEGRRGIDDWIDLSSSETIWR